MRNVKFSRFIVFLFFVMFLFSGVVFAKDNVILSKKFISSLDELDGKEFAIVSYPGTNLVEYSMEDSFDTDSEGVTRVVRNKLTRTQIALYDNSDGGRKDRFEIVLSGNATLWTFNKNKDGTYTISSGGKYLNFGDNNHLLVGNKPGNFIIEPPDATYARIKLKMEKNGKMLYVNCSSASNYFVKDPKSASPISLYEEINYDYENGNYEIVHGTEDIIDGNSFVITGSRDNTNFDAMQPMLRSDGETNGLKRTRLTKVSGNNIVEGSYVALWKFTKKDDGYIISSGDRYINFIGEDLFVSNQEQVIKVLFNGDDSVEIVNDQGNKAHVSGGSDTFIGYSLASKLYLYKPLPYNVWLDSSLGLLSLQTIGNLNKKAYYDMASDKRVSAQDFILKDGKYYIRLPEVDNGIFKIYEWLDLSSGNSYKAGEEIEITKDTVLYASWFPSNYNFKDETKKLSDKVVSTNDFVKTHVFDYNELFNVNSASLSTMLIDYSKHAEGWELDNTKGDFAFKNIAYQRLLKNDTNSNVAVTLANLYGLDLFNLEQNKTDRDERVLNFNGIVAPGILDANDWLLDKLFSKSDFIGKKYLGTGDYLFSYDDSTGYYYYQSSKNASSYNQNDKRFYVYDETEKVQQVDDDLVTPSADDEKNVSDFLPFDVGSTEYNEVDDMVNYSFGMMQTINFKLADDSDVNGSGVLNQSLKNTDTIFKFSGNDDVWIFVDDELVLDLGGMHDSVYGEINFSTGNIVYGDSGDANSAVTVSDMPGLVSALPEKTVNKQFKKGDHVLTIYYLERSSSSSDYAVYFNLNPNDVYAEVEDPEKEEKPENDKDEVKEEEKNDDPVVEEQPEVENPNTFDLMIKYVLILVVLISCVVKLKGFKPNKYSDI